MKNRSRLNEKVAETQKNIKETTTLSQQKHRKPSNKSQFLPNKNTEKYQRSRNIVLKKKLQKLRKIIKEKRQQEYRKLSEMPSE